MGATHSAEYPGAVHTAAANTDGEFPSGTHHLLQRELVINKQYNARQGQSRREKILQDEELKGNRQGTIFE